MEEKEKEKKEVQDLNSTIGKCIDQVKEEENNCTLGSMVSDAHSVYEDEVQVMGNFLE